MVPIAASVLVHRPATADGGVTARAYTGIPGAAGFADALHPLAGAGRADRGPRRCCSWCRPWCCVDLRLPRLRTTVELLTLLPLVLPPIALVVGVRSVLAWAPDYFLNTPLATAFFALQKPALPWILVLVYVRPGAAVRLPGAGRRACAASTCAR